jgi:phenylpropionate dioxygenase-like ring-hydroxylating dioxygenase large terminal subunit
MFIRNCWYVAAFAEEVGSKPLARTIVGDPVVLFRMSNGSVVALEDRCCHRGLPLAHGEVQGDLIQCGYHGLTFDATGRCVRVPGQDRIPPSAKVTAYPVIEQDRLVWIWMGDPAKADPSQIIRYPWHGDPGWAYKGKRNHVHAHYQLIYDNLLDLTHVGYVHRSTIGGDPEAHSNAEMKTTRTDDSVGVIRWLRNSTPPPTYVKAVGFKGKVDRWIEIDFKLGAVIIYAGATDTGTGAYEGKRDGGLGLRTLHAITPETEGSTFYFWTAAHNFKVADAAVTQQVFEQIDTAFEEDRIIIESQHKRLQQQPERRLVDIASDVAAIQARRIIARRLEEEQRSSRPA